MITSLDNKTVKQLRKLHQKKYREDSFLLLEEELVILAKEKGYLKKLVYTGKKPFDHDDEFEVSQDVMDKIAMREGLSFIGVSKMIEGNDDYGRRIVILDRLQDPLNIGRIMEAAQLFGYDTLILSEDCADICHEKCLSACKGGIYTLNIVRKDLSVEIPKLRKDGYLVYATGLRNNTKELHDVHATEKMAFILGNEGSGVREDLMDLSDDIMKIDMRNIDSLNVAMAASIIMYRFRI
ncbi:MAG: RNA methyltransferase [Erysipelotrichaceae bacterium]|nr:RNA methyltransferase [Erysipelotrichaceae bacterium]